MGHPEKTKEQLLEELRRRNDELEAAAAEWRRNKESLLESEQNFKAVAENANEGILIAAGKGTHVYANRRAAEITGYSVSELLETTIKDLSHPEDFSEIMNRYRRIVEGESLPRQHETRVVKKDGEAIPVQVISARTFWKGQPADIVIIRDITERKRTEEALKQSERKFRGLVDNSLVGIYRTNVEGKVFYVNEALTRMLEFDSPEEMMSESALVNYKNHEDRDRLIEILKKSGRVDGFEFDLVTKTGNIRNVLLSAVLDQDVIDGMIMDITERKRAEEALQATYEELERQVEKRTAELVRTNRNLQLEIQERTQVEEALRQSEERFRTIFEKSRDAICLIDEDGHYLMVNETMCALTGVSRQDLTGEHYSTFMDKETHEVMEQSWTLRKGNESVLDRYKFKLIRPDGDIRIVESLPSIIHLPDKGSLTMAILRDVTERTQMEDALESMRSRLLNLQESERSMLSRVLHDTIGQNISILDFNIATIEEVLDQSSRKQISSLVDNMRSIIRETGDKLRDISSGLHPRLIQELGLVEGISSFIDRFRRNTGLQVDSSVLGAHLQVEDSVAVNIYRIIQEAFTNIAKHSKCSLVLFEMKVEDGRLGVIIKDDGIGFSLADVSQPAIDPRGMGLFIMAERVKAIGGKLEIFSEPNQGTKLKMEVDLKA